MNPNSAGACRCVVIRFVKDCNYSLFSRFFVKLSYLYILLFLVRIPSSFQSFTRIRRMFFWVVLMICSFPPESFIYFSIWHFEGTFVHCTSPSRQYPTLLLQFQSDCARFLYHFTCCCASNSPTAVEEARSTIRPHLEARKS